ncbi:MAG: hypothetical protein IPP61_03030 [Cytophagaceae bacterium]|nr:hypothetical protein [Cytophagaceae bacterium]MBL0301328.1 hypothetical protein [Cytophagaceae bacterium]MBL0324147.1 hypothetical protein [Cytophagaceae bacterium]
MALISKKKIPFAISTKLRSYLTQFGREQKIPLKYEDLLRYNSKVTLYDKKGEDTLWETVYYPQSDMEEIYENLKAIYADLKTDGDEAVINHLVVDRVDVCTYANTLPFRIRIINKVNDNGDYFYIKKADSSRIYGLELEHLLSPNAISYITYENTLIEEHIVGITGDLFMQKHLKSENLNPIRLSKEFVKFNERCFVRLLGDMHSSNFVVIAIPDFEDFQYRIRAIDFDQQSFEGSKSVYMPQYFKQNNPLVQLGMKYMTPESVKQYQIEERSLIAGRMKAEKVKLEHLLDCMKTDVICIEENLVKLRKDLAKHYKNKEFLDCKNMGEVVELSLKMVNLH